MVSEDVEQALLDQMVQTVELAPEMPTRFRVSGSSSNVQESKIHILNISSSLLPLGRRGNNSSGYKTSRRCRGEENYRCSPSSDQV